EEGDPLTRCPQRSSAAGMGPDQAGYRHRREGPPPTARGEPVPRPSRPSPRHVAVLAAGALLLTSGLAACTTDGGDAADGGSIAGLLDTVPDTKANRQYIVVNRYDAAEEGAKITPKGDDAGEKE